MKQKAPNPFMLRLFRENEHCVLILGDIATKLQQVDVSGNVRLRRVRVLLLTLRTRNARPYRFFPKIVFPFGGAYRQKVGTGKAVIIPLQASTFPFRPCVIHF